MLFLFLVVAFLIGLVVGSVLPFTPFVAVGVLALSALTLILLERGGYLSHRSGSWLYGSLLAGLLYWTFFAWLNAPMPLSLIAGPAPTLVTGRIAAPVHYAPRRAVFLVSVLHMGKAQHPRPAKGTVQVTWRDPGQDLRQGDLVTWQARLHPPSGQMNPGGFDYAAYLTRHGVDAVASISGPDALVDIRSAADHPRWVAWHLIDEWRDRIRQAALHSLNDPARGIYLGIIIGQPGYLTADGREAFMNTGTVHILSISGSHLGMVGLLSFFVLRRIGLYLPARWLLALSRHITPTRVAALGTAIPVTAYTLLAGSEIATIRSWIMISVFLLAVWLGRQEHLLLALTCAALLIVLHDPRSLFDISFQLSYSSVLAIALVVRWHLKTDATETPPPKKIEQRVVDWIKAYGWITGGVTFATMPLVAYHFHQVAWLGLIANLLVVPLAGLLLVPLGLGSALWIAVTGGPTLPGAFFNQIGFDFLSGLVHTLALIPGAAWHIAAPTLISWSSSMRCCSPPCFSLSAVESNWLAWQAWLF